MLVAQALDPDAYRETLKADSDKRATEAFKEPFVGITADGKVQSGLYTLNSTGISTAPIVDAAKAFLNTLDPKQRDEVSFPALDIEWRKWANQANYYRDGLWFEKMSEAQRQAAFGLLAASLSARGVKLIQEIMKSNEILGVLNNEDFAKYGEWKYWISIMGEPSVTEPWGWQLDGHHMGVSYLVLGDQVVMSPAFLGAEPTTITASGVMTEEAGYALDLIRSLTPVQMKQAIIKPRKDRTNLITDAFSDNEVIPYAGVQVSGFTPQQKALLKKVLGLWVGNMREEHARVRMAEVERYLEQTWFAWIGETGDDAPIYYRIQSPVILIEFDHQRPQGIVNLYKPEWMEDAYRGHIHAVMRTPNGNDYGIELLKQHHAKSTQHGQDGKPLWQTQ